MWYLGIAAFISKLVFTGLLSNAIHQLNLNILKSLMRTPASKTQHTPFTFFRATAGLIELKHSISNEVIRRRSLFQPFEIHASRHQDSLNDVKHSDGRCLLVLGKTNHWPQLPLHGAILNRDRGSDNKQTTQLFFWQESLWNIFLSSWWLSCVVLVPAKRTSQDCRSLSVCLALCPVLTRRCSTAAESRLSGLVVGLFRSHTRL